MEKIKIWAKEILMCGLKKTPLIGTAVEVAEAVNNRYEQFAVQGQLQELRESLTSFERRMRDVACEEVRRIASDFTAAGLEADRFEENIRNFRSIQQYGYAPALFEGLLRNSPHWEKLVRTPHHYGEILTDATRLDPAKIPVLIDADKLRILELKPGMFAILLENQQADSAAGLQIVKAPQTQDIWAFPGETSAQRIETPSGSFAAAKSDAPRILRPTPAKARPSESAAALTLDLGGGVKMELMLIPAGEFLMGSLAAEEGRLDHEGPQHRVKISKPFYLGKYQVTQKQWQAVVGNNPSYSPGDDLPAECVSWEDCQEFCEKLAARVGYAVRLPTEAEWEYACRAGTKTRFHAGDSDSALDKCAWFGVNSGFKTHPVGQKKPNAWGLYDMHGNVWEWCQDWKNNYSSGDAVDPTGPEGGSDRVLRGGSYLEPLRHCRAAYRDMGRSPATHFPFAGLRVAVGTL